MMYVDLHFIYGLTAYEKTSFHTWKDINAHVEI